MAREKALDKSRWIFRELIAEVEKKGKKALVHPDYEPITKAERDKILLVIKEEIAKGTFPKLHRLSKQ